MTKQILRRMGTWASVCGILSIVFYLLHDVIGAVNYPGYRWMRQAVSDLTATDAPSFIIARALSGIHGIFTGICCAFLCVMAMNARKSLKIGIYLLTAMHGVSAIGYSLFPLSGSGYDGSVQSFIKEMQQRKEILSWDDIASAIAYPKAMSDKEHVSGGTPDEFKLLHQAERINRIFISQMEELFEELERTELQLTQHKYINRCISRLEKEDREIIDQFVRKDMTFEKGMTEFHMARSTLYKLQKKAIENLTVIYNE